MKRRSNFLWKTISFHDGRLVIVVLQWTFSLPKVADSQEQVIGSTPLHIKVDR